MSPSPDRRELIDALVELAEEIGWAPIATEMAARGRYSPNDYYREFGGWENAIEAAEIDKRSSLVRDIRQVAHQVDSRPSTIDVQRLGHYSSDVHTQFFGSWERALAEADISSGRREDDTEIRAAHRDASQTIEPTEEADVPPTSEAYLSELTRLQRESDLVVRARDMDQHGEFSASDIILKFGSWDAALEEAGIDKEAILRAELKRVAEDLGHPPTQLEMNEHGKCSFSMYANYFGSWSAAKGACLDLDETPDEFPRDTVLDELRRIDEEIDRPITARDVREDESLSFNAIAAQFDSLNAALEAAGLDREAELLEEIRRVANIVGTRPRAVDVRKHGYISSTMLTNYFESFSTAIDRALEGSDTSDEQGSSGHRDGREPQDETPEIPPDQVTKASIDEAGRIEHAFVIRVLSVEEDPTVRVSALLEVEDLEGVILPLKIWDTHEVRINWVTGHWYTLLAVTVNRWETDGTTETVLNSSADFEALHHGSRPPTLTSQPSGTDSDVIDPEESLLDEIAAEFDGRDGQ